MSAALPDSGFWRFLCYQQSHVEWVGCSLHDLIQPSFSFLVGVVLPFSIAKRRSSGQTFRATALHAAIRSFVLIVLGIAIISIHPKHMIWKFEDTLTQIGLCYFPLFLLAHRSPREWWLAFAVILVGYWLAFALYPLPGPDFDYAKVGVSAEWLKEHGLTGFAAHWQKNSNIALAFDNWFLPLFPGNSPFISPKGLATLNFVPLLGTMILGLVAGDVLRSARDPWAKVRWFFVAGGALLAAGWSLGALGVCPVVKTIWTPSWVLFSGGWCFLFLATFLCGRGHLREKANRVSAHRDRDEFDRRLLSSPHVFQGFCVQQPATDFWRRRFQCLWRCILSARIRPSGPPVPLACPVRHVSAEAVRANIVESPDPVSGTSFDVSQGSRTWSL